MKKIIIILVLSLFFVDAYSQKSKKVKNPSFSDIVTSFYSMYSDDLENENHDIRFEKRPEGWFVATFNKYDKSIVVKNELFWSSKKEKYKKLDFNIVKEHLELIEKRDAQMTSWRVRMFKLYPFYGYTGYEHDVIEYYSSKEELTDSNLYALGRVHSSLAANLLHDNSGTAEPDWTYDLGEGQNLLNDAQLENYRNYSHKAIDYFGQVVQMNPEFETIVGEIGLKWANEHLTAFLDLRIVQNEEEALKELKDSLYSDFYISVAKNYLNSCPQNAILFTNGDNDTYPLLYVQARDSYRTDVLVVNVSLLSTYRYIYNIQQQVLEAPAYPLSISMDQFESRLYDYAYLGVDDTLVFDLDSLNDYLQDTSHAKLSVKGNYVLNIPTNKFKLNAGENDIEFTLDVDYLQRGDIAMLDMLHTNKWNRPVCFAVTLYKKHFLGLDHYLQYIGFVKLLGENRLEKIDDYESVNTLKMYDNIMNKFNWEMNENCTKHERSQVMNYRNLNRRLAIKLLDENKKDSAVAVLDSCIVHFPDEYAPYDLTMLGFIELYYRTDETEKANHISRVYYENVIQDKQDYSSPERWKLQKPAIINELKRLAKEYDQDELYREFKD